MAKGQQRGNREKRKPKQPKKVEAAPVAFGSQVEAIKNREAAARKAKS
jgi:hypothetical protein